MSEGPQEEQAPETVDEEEEGQPQKPPVKAPVQDTAEELEVVIVEKPPDQTSVAPEVKEAPSPTPPVPQGVKPESEVVVVEEAPQDISDQVVEEAPKPKEPVPDIPPEEFPPEEMKVQQAPSAPPPPMDDENPEIVIKEEEKPPEAEEGPPVGEKKDEEPIKCPICGSVNQAGSTQCFLCQTHLSRDEGGKIKVKSPKLPGDILTMVDIEDPVTRRKLEELTLIPGVSRVKALYLFQSGISSMEEFIEKAFRGEKLSKNFSRSVTNKLLMESIKGGQEAEEVKLVCPSCNAPNKADAANCGVCGYEIDKDMQAVNLDDVASKLNVKVDEVFGDLMESDDFKALPEELKAQMAMAMESDDYDDMRDVTAEMELFDLKDVKAPEEEAAPEAAEEARPEAETEEEPEPAGEEEEADGFAFEKAAEPETEAPAAEPEPPVEEPVEGQEVEQEPEEATEEEAPPEPPIQAEPEATGEPDTPEEEHAQPEPSEVEPEAQEKAGPSPEELEQKKAEHAKKVAERKQKIRDTLLEKMDQWRRVGYDVDDLEQYLDDLNEFKVKAKEALKKGKTVKEKYKKQLEMWKEKGFDVAALEPLLDTDVLEFKEKAKDILKGQKE